MAAFAIAVQPGCEAQAAELLASSVGSAAVSLPVSELRQVKDGETMCEEAPALPGYVLLEAENAHAVRKACRRARGLADFRSARSETYELSHEEEGKISQFFNQGNFAQFSEGTVYNGQLFVRCGALVGREGLVGRINHRGKRAYVPVTVGGNPAELQLGLRITRKGGATS